MSNKKKSSLFMLDMVMRIIRIYQLVYLKNLKTKGIDSRFLIIENNYKAKLKSPIINSSNISLIKGNNQYGEFSGWLKGLSYLKKKIN